MKEYRDLVTARKQCRLCMLCEPGKLRNGAEFPFDPPVLSHWAQWLGDKNPELVIIGQDFGSTEYFERYQGQDDPKNKTNKNLYDLLTAAGFSVQQPPAADYGSGVYLANAILCLKLGKMNTPIKDQWIDACADNHLISLLEHLRPSFVIGMGAGGWRAARRVFRLGSAPKPISIAAGTRWNSANGTHVFAVGHCGPLGCVTRSRGQQILDWQRIGEFVREQKASSSNNPDGYMQQR